MGPKHLAWPVSFFFCIWRYNGNSGQSPGMRWVGAGDSVPDRCVQGSLLQVRSVNAKICRLRNVQR